MFDHPRDFIRVCLTNFQADVDVSDYPKLGQLGSFDGETFLGFDYRFGEFIFQLFGATRTFHLYERNVSPIKQSPADFNDVVYRGRCEFTQP